MTENIDMTTRLDLVVVGFDVPSIDKFKTDLESKQSLKNKGFQKGKTDFIKPPADIPAMLPFVYTIKNNHFMTIKYHLLEKRLIITQDSYLQDNFNYDENISEILDILLTIAPASSISAFGINYSTEVLRERKLTLLNPNIEDKLGNDFWSTNVGFQTELAFKENEYTSIYRIYKNEKEEQKENERSYNFDVNYNFELKYDNNAKKIMEIFSQNQSYYETYRSKVRSILSL